MRCDSGGRGDKLCENSNPLQSLTPDSTTWGNEDLCTRSRTENGFQLEYGRMKMLGPNLATCQLVTQVENYTNPMSKLCEKMEEKTKQKQGGCGVGIKGV